MRTETFQSILYGVAKRLGMNPGRDLTATTAERLTEYVNDRVKEGWRFDFWPEWTVTEKRYLREYYVAANNVAAGDERYFIAGQGYYQALRAQTPAAVAPATLTAGVYVENSAYWAACASSYVNGDGSSPVDWATGTVFAVGDKTRNPSDDVIYQCFTAHTAGGSFDGSKFGALKAFDRYIAYEQSQGGVALTPMDEVKLVSARNPRVNQLNPGAVGFAPSDHGIQVAPSPSAPAYWVTFRLRPPVFTSTLYVSGRTYAAGALVYYPPGGGSGPTPGECYVCLASTTGNAPTNTTYWRKVNFPAALATWVKWAASADGYGDQKQQDRKQVELHGEDGNGGAYRELEEAASRALEQQGQYERASVQTYGS